MEDKKFDRIAGIYVFCMQYHGGQWTRRYRLMCRIKKHYKLRLTDRAIDSIIYGKYEWLEAHDVYRRLEEKYRNIQY